MLRVRFPSPTPEFKALTLLANPFRYDMGNLAAASRGVGRYPDHGSMPECIRCYSSRSKMKPLLYRELIVEAEVKFQDVDPGLT